MQYTIAILLVIVSLQAARALRDRAFWFVAFGWFANLAYLAASRASQEHFSALIRITRLEPDTLANFFDFVANGLFWFAAHKYGRARYKLYLAKVPDPLFCLLLAFLYGTSVGLDHFLPQQKYAEFFFVTLPVVLLDTAALVSLGLYFGELGHKLSKAVHSRALLLSGGTVFYASIQPLQLLAHEITRRTWDVDPLAFSLGFLAKILILFGMVRVFVASAETLVESIAERKRAEQLVHTIDRVAHELGNPVGEIQSVVLGLSEERLSAAASRNLTSLESSSQRIAAILGSLMLEIDPINKKLVARKSDGSWSAEEVSHRQVANINTMIEVAKNAVKRARAERVKYSHQYSRDCCINCVPNEIVQILINILRNAYDSFQAPNALVQIRTQREKRASVGPGEPVEQVRVIVRDNGEGIKLENLERIFQQGFSTRGGLGRGFGMAIVRDLVKKNSGTVDVFSPPHFFSGKDSRGTEIVLTFPRVACVH